MMKRSTRIYNVCVPIMIGAFLYYIFCPDVLFVKTIDSWTGLNLHIDINYDNMWIRLVRFYLFDFLWAYSLMFLALSLSGRKNYKFIIPAVLLFELAMELIQLASAIKGTFDIFDLFTELIANVLVIKILSGGEESNEEV